MFDVALGVSVSLSGMTISEEVADNGGGIYNAGKVTINDAPSAATRPVMVAAASTTKAR